MKKDEFYIGWNKEMPSGYRRFSIVIISALSFVVILFTLVFVMNSNDFAESRYDFGNQTRLKGIIHEYPVPMLVLEGNDSTRAIPLVNFGKFGVGEIITFFKSQMRNDLQNYEVELRGTLIGFDNRTWLELTDQNRSLLSFRKLDEPSPPREVQKLRFKEVTGEIVDPKCFFGVMKPGFGKVHLSCAVRCISGGIPPILVSPEQDGTREYYFVTGSKGRMINDDILNYVGMPIRISGIIKQVDGWKVLEMKKDDIKIAGNFNGTSIFNTCQPGMEDLKLADAQQSK